MDCVGGGAGTASVGAEVEVGDSVEGAGCWEGGLGERGYRGLESQARNQDYLQGVWQ